MSFFVHPIGVVNISIRQEGTSKILQVECSPLSSYSSTLQKLKDYILVKIHTKLATFLKKTQGKVN